MSEQFFDDVLDLSKNTRRKYRTINNSDGTVSFEDVTVYLREGSKFGADEVNDLMSLSDDVANTKPNLIPFPYYYPMSNFHNGINYTVQSDGSVVAVGTKNTSTVSQYYFTYNSTQEYRIKPNTAYTLSGCPKGGSSTTYRLRIIFYKDTSSATNLSQVLDYGNGVTFTTPSDAVYARIMIDLYGADSSYNLTFYPMLVEGSVAPTKYKMYGDMTCAGKLVAGATTLELASDKIKTTSLIDTYFYATDGTAIEPISYSTIKVENGKVTYTFDALASDLIVGVKVM